MRRADWKGLWMQQYEVILGGKLVGAPADKATAALDSAMEHLLDCIDLIDPSIDFTRSTRNVTIAVIVDAADSLDGIQKASALVRSALHAADVGTQGWPGASELAASIVFDSAQRVELVSA